MKKLSFFLFFLFISNLFASHNLEKISLQLKWKHAFQFAGYYMAKEKGFYNNIGLDVDIKEYNRQDILKDVISGKTVYGVLDSSLILKRSKGAPVVALAAIFQHSPLELMTLKSSNITKISQLKHKKIMATKEFIENPYIKAMFYVNRVYPRDLKIVPSDYNLDRLINKRVDAFAVYITDQPYTMQKRDIKYNLINSMSYGIDFYSDILFTSEKEIAEHPERVKEFLIATLKGWKYAFDHINETIAVINTKYNTQNFSFNKLKYEANQMIKLSEVYSDDFGKIKKDKIDNIVTMYGITGKKIDRNRLKNFVYHLDDKKTKLTQKELNFLHNKKVIKMCVDPNWMPLEMIKNGKHIGISADYFKLFEQKIDIPIQLVVTKSWPQSLEYAKSRKCDILSLAMSTDNRKKYMNFTKPYLSIPLVIATKMDKLFISDVKSIKMQKLGITKGYAFIDILKKKYPGINLIEVNSIQEGLQKVYEGKLYGFIDTLFSVSYELQKSYFGELKIAGKFDDKWQLGIGVRNDEPLLLSAFNKIINKVNEKQKQKILNYWVAIKYDRGFDYGILKYIGGFFLIGVVLFVHREKTLKKYNKILEEKNRELEILASTDALTGVKSRRNFFDIGKQYILMAKRDNIPLSFIMLDIDYFKKVNDTYGHMAGDEVLKNFTQIISNNLRKSDIFGRVGGEEFAIMLHNTDKNTALQVAEKIRKQISDDSVKYHDKNINITVSLGVAVLKDDDTLDSLFNKADKALYTSKQNGRNQITAA